MAPPLRPSMRLRLPSLGLGTAAAIILVAAATEPSASRPHNLRGEAQNVSQMVAEIPKDCALSGFWAMGDHIVVRFWRLEDASAGSSSWKAMYFPRNGAWPYGQEGSKEGAIQVGQTRPDALAQCLERSGDASDWPQAVAPFVHGVSVWSGTLELSFWGGVAEDAPAITWQSTLDAEAWDSAAESGSVSSCPVAANIDHLVGQLVSVQHALWGFRSCKVEQVKRFAPEVVSLTSAGWAEVMGYDWKFGLAIFVRRLCLAHGLEVASESCFEKLLDDLRLVGSSLPMDELTSRLEASECTKSAR